MRRRKLLALLGGSLSAAAAGCIGDDDDDDVDDGVDVGDDDDVDDGDEPDLDPAEFAVGIAETNSPVEGGGILEVVAGVTNVGEESGEETIALTIPGIGEVDQSTVALDGGESTELVLEWNTLETNVGDHSVEVSSGDDSDTIAVTVETLEPEIEADEVVTVVSNAFEPDLAEVDVGETVMWTGEEGSHTVTFYHDEADTQHRVPRGVTALDESVGAGEETHYEFTEPGVYTYFCRPHEGQGMVGAIIVGDDDDPFQPGLSAPDDDLPAAAAAAIEDLTERARDALGIDPDAVVDEVQIDALPDGFEPELVEVAPGAEITWVGHDENAGNDENGDVPHTVTFYHEDNDTQHRVPNGVEALDAELEAGQEVTVVVEEQGVYDYYSRGYEEEGVVGSLVVGNHDDPTQPGLTAPAGDLPEAAAATIESLNQQAIDILEIPTVSEAVEEANATIEMLNTDPDGSIGTINEGLENVEDVDPIAPVEAETPEETAAEADRLRDEVDRLTHEILMQVPREINAQSQQVAGIDLLSDPDPEDIETPDDAREAADGLPPLGEATEEAASALYATADIVETIDEELHRVADILDGTVSD